MKQTADTSGAEAFNPYLTGGVSGAKFNALSGTADYEGNVLGNYASAMESYKKSQRAAAVAAEKQKNEEKMKELQDQADLMGKSDDLKTQMFNPLFGEGFDKDEVQAAINFSIKIDNAFHQGKSLRDIQNDIKETADDEKLDPLVSQYLNQYAMKSYNLYGNTYQSAELPQAEPEQPGWLSRGWDKIKSLF
jgi:hypothetical protein